MTDDSMDHDDHLASEYVLGLLDAGARAAAELRLLGDPAFAERVAHWQGLLRPLDSAYAPAAPPARVKSALDRRLFGAAPSGLWSSLTFWRGLAAAGLAAALLLAVLPTRQTPGPQLVASLQNAEQQVQIETAFDRTSNLLRINFVAGQAPAGRDFELWVIKGDNPPASLGLVQTHGLTSLIVPEPLRPHFTGPYKLAITDEPAGGSPTGLATGAVVAIGDSVEL
jgi:anti-sigma-K factor RskA